MRGQTSGARILAAIGTAILDVSVAAEPARAQDVPLAQLLPQLILSGITLDSLLCGSSTGGMTYVFDESVGTRAFGAA